VRSTHFLLIASKNGAKMSITIKGNAGDYLIRNEFSILEVKLDKTGNQTGESKVHVIADSIEDQDDRIMVIQKLRELEKI
jgi:hypothetical protein